MTKKLLFLVLLLASCGKKKVEQSTPLKVAVSTHSVALSWTASTTTGVSYNVYRGSQLIGNTAALSYTDTAVVPGTTYSYSFTSVCVTCVSGITGEGPHSLSVSATIPGGTTPCTAIAVGCRVQVTPGSSPRNVRGSGPSSGYGALIFLEPGGAQATIIGGPNTSTLGFSWWNLTFDSCSTAFTVSTNCTGWMASSQLVLIGGTPPPVLTLTCAGNVCTVGGATSGQTGSIQLIPGGATATWKQP